MTSVFSVFFYWFWYAAICSMLYYLTPCVHVLYCIGSFGCVFCQYQWYSSSSHGLFTCVVNLWCLCRNWHVLPFAVCYNICTPRVHVLYYCTDCLFFCLCILPVPYLLHVFVSRIYIWVCSYKRPPFTCLHIFGRITSMSACFCFACNLYVMHMLKDFPISWQWF